MGTHHWKDEWRSASMEHGARYVTLHGVFQMLLWCVDNWGTQHKVNVSMFRGCVLIKASMHTTLNLYCNYILCVSF